MRPARRATTLRPRPRRLVHDGVGGEVAGAAEVLEQSAPQQVLVEEAIGMAQCDGSCRAAACSCRDAARSCRTAAIFLPRCVIDARAPSSARGAAPLQTPAPAPATASAGAGRIGRWRRSDSSLDG